MPPVNFIGALGEPVELAPGRGDLRYSSYPVGGADGLNSRSVPLVGDIQISYAEIVASQQWVAAAVFRMLTWAVRVPLKAYEKTGDDSRRRLTPDEHPLAAALVDPFDRGSQADLVQQLLGPMLTHGNSLAEIEQGAAGRLRFGPRDWRYVRPIRPFRDRIAGWVVDHDEDGGRAVPSDTMLHLKWWSPLGPLGISPLQQLGTTLAIENAAQRMQVGMLRNSARPPSAVIASEAFLGIDREQREALLANLREDITNLYASPENSGRPALLPPGLTWEQIGHTAVEAELMNQRRVAREEIAAVYQIPPPMLGILDKATYSNIETQREMAYTDALAPPLVLIEQSINAQLVRSLLRETDIYVEFDFAGVLRGDRLKEVQAMREAISTGLLTINEGRSGLNMPRSDEAEADQLWMPSLSNMQTLGSTPQTDATPIPEGAPNA